MEQSIHTNEDYDFRQYERVWQRVAPALEPYQGMTAQNPGALVSRLPGADRNPCCMGSEAAADLEVLTGFIEEELAEQRQFLALAQQAPVWARTRLREIAFSCCEHARRLMAVYYLITGETYTPAVSLERIYVGRWCPALRERYHSKACGGLNYARAAEATADPCLEKLLEDLSAEEYRHASELLRMLERAMRK